MSTKIFVHRVYKAHKPDPAAIAQSAASIEENARRQEKRAETKRVMRELLVEELSQRAAKQPERMPFAVGCCPRCWAVETSSKYLIRNGKIMSKMYKEVRRNREPTSEFATAISNELIDMLFREMAYAGVSILEPRELGEIAADVFQRTLRAAEKGMGRHRTEIYVPRRFGYSEQRQ